MPHGTPGSPLVSLYVGGDVVAFMPRVVPDEENRLLQARAAEERKLAGERSTHGILAEDDRAASARERPDFRGQRSDFRVAVGKAGQAGRSFGPRAGEKVGYFGACGA